jgi:hypothetical protein
MTRNNPLLIAAVLIVTPLLATGQQLVASGGATSTNTNTALSWSIGEPVIGVAHSAQHSMVLGFQQPYLMTITSVSVDAEKGFQVFPNPVRDRIFVERPNLSLRVRVILYDVNGKNLNEVEFEDSKPQLEIITEALNAGVYLLRGFSGERLVFERKIIKL